MKRESSQTNKKSQSKDRPTAACPKRRWSMRNTLILIFLIIAGLSIYMVIHNIGKQREMKIKDLQMRFEELAIDVKNKVQAQPEDQARPLEDYYYPFWDLQLEQYQLWKKKFITPEIYTSWMDLRYREWMQNDTVAGKTYQEAWEETKKHLSNDEFSRFMEDVFKGNRKVYADGPP